MVFNCQGTDDVVCVCGVDAQNGALVVLFFFFFFFTPSNPLLPLTVFGPPRMMVFFCCSLGCFVQPNVGVSAHGAHQAVGSPF